MELTTANTTVFICRTRARIIFLKVLVIRVAAMIDSDYRFDNLLQYFCGFLVARFALPRDSKTASRQFVHGTAKRKSDQAVHGLARMEFHFEWLRIPGG